MHILTSPPRVSRHGRRRLFATFLFHPKHTARAHLSSVAWFFGHLALAINLIGAFTQASDVRECDAPHGGTLSAKVPKHTASLHQRNIASVTKLPPYFPPLSHWQGKTGLTRPHHLHPHLIESYYMPHQLKQSSSGRISPSFTMSRDVRRFFLTGFLPMCRDEVCRRHSGGEPHA
jgi:hypothetical protein